MTEIAVKRLHPEAQHYLRSDDRGLYVVVNLLGAKSRLVK